MPCFASVHVAAQEADLIVEVAHPSIVAKYGAKFVAHADLMVGSPTCFADQQVPIVRLSLPSRWPPILL